MKIPSFMKINQHTRFEFTPRYYDERKERLESIKAKYSGNSSEEEFQERIKGSFKQSAKTNTKKGSKTNTRLIMIIAILSYLSWTFIIK